MCGDKTVKNILIIEDEENFRLPLCDFLTLENFNVIAAANGCTGLQLAKELHPDLIICDLRLDDIDGFVVLEHLRADLTTFNIPLIFLTADANKNSYNRAMQLGANAYITKPVELGTLLDAIASQLLAPH